MKRFLSILLCTMLCISAAVGFTACGKEKVEDAAGLWANATYQSDTALGEGSKTFSFEVKAEERSVVFTIKTDADTVGAALLENNLVAGEMGDYGLYVKTVNGMTADYDTDGCYWAFYDNGAYATASADQTAIVDGSTYMFSCE